ncbi:MAG: hypothetical protein NTW15_04570 [Burkholderiales bacterium]|nr:hypothetical protein [Burkholderiales bacterium]
MSPEIVPLLQLVGLVAVGLLLRSRVMLLLVAAAIVGLVVLDILPSNLAARTPQQLAMDFGGVAVGLLAGLWAAAISWQRVDAKRWAREIEASSPRSRGAAAPAERTSGAPWVLAPLLFAVAAGVGLYIEGTTVPEWRRTMDGWLASPTLQALGLPGLHGVKAAPTVLGTQAWAPAAAPAGKRSGEKRSGDKVAGDKPRAHPVIAGERSQGDMRHCLEQSGTSDGCAAQSAAASDGAGSGPVFRSDDELDVSACFCRDVSPE